MTIELSLADGDNWSAANVNSVEAAINTAVPVCTVISNFNPSAPNSDWVAMGSTITNAQTLNTALWAVAPTSWRSGSNLVLPSMANRMLEGVGTTAVGATGGSNTVTISTTNMPSHSHTIDHGHTASSGIESVGHTHGITDPGHSHAQNVAAAGTGGLTTRADFTADTTSGGIFSQTGVATDVATTGITTGGVSANHTHAITVNSHSGSSGSAGSGSALTVTNAHVGVYFYLKVF